jgi:hypothetical protein
MFLIESCKHCPICDTVTRHSRRWFSIALGLAFAFALVGASQLFLAPSDPVGGCIFLFIAMAIVAFDRERMWRIRCERCRSKALRDNAKTKPDLANTEINIL